MQEYRLCANMVWSCLRHDNTRPNPTILSSLKANRHELGWKMSQDIRLHSELCPQCIASLCGGPSLWAQWNKCCMSLKPCQMPQTVEIFLYLFFSFWPSSFGYIVVQMTCKDKGSRMGKRSGDVSNRKKKMKLRKKSFSRRRKKMGQEKGEERGAKRRSTAVGWINGWCDRSQPPRY